MGNNLLKFLIAEYLVIMIAFAVNRDWARSTYFLGAAIISIAVLFMKGGL
jgi:hypothetical protein